MFDSDYDLSPLECQDIVSHPGKFESCPSYVPFMWNRINVWGEFPDYDKTHEAWNQDIPDDSEIDLEEYWYDGIMPDIYRYDVTLFDIALFPDLRDVSTVFLMETDQGFVEVYDETRIDRPSWTIIAIDSPFMGI